MDKELLLNTLNNLTVMIVSAANQLSNEQSCPGGDVDTSDDSMKMLKERIIGLRNIREDLEILMTGVILK